MSIVARKIIVHLGEKDTKLIFLIDISLLNDIFSIMLVDKVSFSFRKNSPFYFSSFEVSFLSTGCIKWKQAILNNSYKQYIRKNILKQVDVRQFFTPGSSHP